MEKKVCKSCNKSFASEADYLEGAERWRKCASGHLWFNCSCGSTLVLLKGTFEGFSEKNHMSSEAFDYFTRLSNKESIPHLPTHIYEIQQVILDPKSSSQKIAQALKKEPVLASQVLISANNARFCSDQKIQSIEHAVTFVGRGEVSELVSLAAIQSLKPTTKRFNIDAFWAEALFLGKLSEYLRSKLAPDLEEDFVYLAAVLTNIGKLVLALCRPDDLDKVYDSVNDPNSPKNWVEAENAVRVMNHCVLGEVGACFWGLPDFVIDACRWHHTWKDNVDERKPPTVLDIITLANQLAHWVNLEPHRIDRNVESKIFKKFFLTDSKIDNLLSSFSSMTGAA